VSSSTDEFLSKHPRSEYANPSLPQRSLALPQLAEYIKKYQDPSQADSIMKIQQELDQTKIVLYVLWSC
jgi:synaptobrevin family protein YKT6